jgi:hypothetical protein
MGKAEEQAKAQLAQKHHLHLKRKFFHAFNGLLIFSIYQSEAVGWLLGGAILVPCVVFAWALEIGRLKFPAVNDMVIKYSGHIMRANEVAKPSGTLSLALRGTHSPSCRHLLLPDRRSDCWHLSSTR